MDSRPQQTATTHLIASPSKKARAFDAEHFEDESPSQPDESYAPAGGDEDAEMSDGVAAPIVDRKSSKRGVNRHLYSMQQQQGQYGHEKRRMDDKVSNELRSA